jgi:hypothetical protein
MDPPRRGNADGIRLRIAARCAPEGRGRLRHLMGFMIQTAADGHGASAPAGMAVEIHFKLQASGSAAGLFTPRMVWIKG